MYIHVKLKEHPEVKAIVTAGFPSYRKLSASISPFGSGVRINSYWDGGSRSEFAIVDMTTGRRMPLPTSTHPYFDVARHGAVNVDSPHLAIDHVGNATLKVLPEGFALVEAGTFCGKAATAHVYLNDANLTKFLPTPPAEVVRMRCDSCEALMIQGVFCHESGCPNTSARYDAETVAWVKTRKCFECGCTVDADSSCCNAEVGE